MTGIVQNLFLKPGHGLPMHEVSSCEAVAGKGLRDDISFGRSRRQVLLIDESILRDFDLSPGDVRENITLSGVDTSGLTKNSRIQIGAVTLQITGPCAPCAFLDSLEEGLSDRMEGKRGVLAKVLSDGTLQVGDSVQVAA